MQFTQNGRKSVWQAGNYLSIVTGPRLFAATFLALLLGSIATSQGPGESNPTHSSSADVPFPGVLPGTIAPPAGKSGPIVQTAVSADMIGFSHVDGSGTQIITLVHTGKSWMAVYHVDRTGVIRLVSSRPIDADFSLQLNATSPLPEEIRSLGGKSR